MPRLGEGPVPAKIMLVGESYSYDDERACAPFQGESGKELNRMLHEAGIMRSECYCTNLVNLRPPGGNTLALFALAKKDMTSKHVRMNDKYVLPTVVAGYQRLQKEIAAVRPNVIVALGNSAMWALCGAWGIAKWRGSMLTTSSGVKLIPTFAHWSITSQWENRVLLINDLRRAKREMETPTYQNLPAWNFTVRPRFQMVMDVLNTLYRRAEMTTYGDSDDTLWIDFDLETRAGHIACAGLSWSRTDALCIPFMCVESLDGYWNLEEEATIVHRLYQLLTHPRVSVRWQNGLYDAQYTYRHWHLIPRGKQDTMIAQHTAFVALPKSLSFQASMYSPHYVYWKDDGKTWHANASEEQLWGYNCQDCVRTREVGESLSEVIPALGLSEVDRFQQSLFYPVLRAMLLGVRVDQKTRDRLATELQAGIADREAFLEEVLGMRLNPKSPKQMVDLFYNVLQQPKQMTRAKKGVPGHLTCDDEALKKIGEKEPLLRPIIGAISDIRTLGVFLSTFVLARLDTDGRMRTSFNIAGNAKVEASGEQATTEKAAPYTYRLSSSQNAFGSGCNMMNIPSDKSKAVGKAKARGMTFQLPNMRSMYVPDPGMEFFDMDLDRADLQVVVWEAEDEMLRTALRMGVDIHLLNVYGIDGQEPPPLDELVETHPSYGDHRAPRKYKREFAKVFCHATNYGGGARTVAANTGRTVHEIDKAQKAWFGAHPGIKRWHDRTLEQVTKRHFVENRFGYRWHIFDRLDGILPEALAWIPQSTVGCYINRIWKNIYDNIPEVQVLIQVHDSLAGQFPIAKREECLRRIEEESQVVIPYEVPLIIPVGIKTSTVSWGDCA